MTWIGNSFTTVEMTKKPPDKLLSGGFFMSTHLRQNQSGDDSKEGSF